MREVSLRQAMLMEWAAWEAHLPMSRAREEINGAQLILLPALLCPSLPCPMSQLKAVFYFPQAIVMPAVVTSLPHWPLALWPISRMMFQLTHDKLLSRSRIPSQRNSTR